MGFFDDIGDRLLDTFEVAAMVVSAPIIVPYAVIDTIIDEFRDDDDEYLDREESIEQAIEEEQEEKRNNIRKEIEEYKVKQQKKMKKSHGVSIEFVSEEGKPEDAISLAVAGMFANVQQLEKASVRVVDRGNKEMVLELKRIKDETEELIHLIGELEVMKDEALR